MSAGLLLNFNVQYESAGPCWKCGVEVLMPRNRLRSSREDGAEFFCCNGHSAFFTKTRVKELEEEVERAKKRAEWAEQSAKSAREQRDAADRRAAAARGLVTKIKNRVGNGVCPCCRRSFANLQRHMATKHPTFKDDGAT